MDEFTPGSVEHKIYLSLQSRHVQDNLKRLMSGMNAVRHKKGGLGVPRPSSVGG